MVSGCFRFRFSPSTNPNLKQTISLDLSREKPVSLWGHSSWQQTGTKETKTLGYLKNAHANKKDFLMCI